MRCSSTAIRDVKHRVYVKRETANGKRRAVACHKSMKMMLSELASLSLLKSYLIRAAKKQEMSSYQTCFFDFWVSLLISPPNGIQFLVFTGPNSSLLSYLQRFKIHGDDFKCFLWMISHITSEAAQHVRRFVGTQRQAVRDSMLKSGLYSNVILLNKITVIR